MPSIDVAISLHTFIRLLWDSSEQMNSENNVFQVFSKLENDTGDCFANTFCQFTEKKELTEKND